MTSSTRLSTSSALIVCLVGTHLSGTLFASTDANSSKEANPSASAVSVASSATESTSSARPAASVDLQPIYATDVASAPPFNVARSRFTLSDEELAASTPPAKNTAHVWQGTFNFIPDESTVAAQRGGYRGRGSRGEHNGAAAAIILGSAAAIAGTATLVYANRPECSTSPMASGCGYGTKVVGGAVLAAGLIGVFVGAATWR
jgi:hypothetical protein